MKINPMPKSGEDAFMEGEAPVARQKVEVREKHAKTFEELWNAFRKRIKDSYDKKHKSIFFRPGEEVLLSSKNFRIRRLCKKLIECYFGPFKVEQSVGKNAYRLIFPESYSHMHNTFHVSLLEFITVGQEMSSQVRLKSMKSSSILSTAYSKHAVCIVTANIEYAGLDIVRKMTHGNRKETLNIWNCFKSLRMLKQMFRCETHDSSAENAS
jgi:hypothetical protein